MEMSGDLYRLIPLLTLLWTFTGLSADIPLFQLEPNGHLRKIRMDKHTDLFEKTELSQTVNYPIKIRRRRSASTLNETFDSSSSDNKIDKSDSNSIGSKEKKRGPLLGLDLLIVTDHSIYQYFLITNNKNDMEAVAAIYDYFSSILMELTKIYSSKRLGRIKFNIYPVGIIVSKNFQDAPWILAASKHNNHVHVRRKRRPKSLDAYDVLTEFRQWVKREGGNLPEHDHAISITRYDLTRFKDKRAQGIAYVKSICKLGDSVSIVEDVGAMATAAVAGHELAHSLGAQHDGTQNARLCNKKHNYLMVPAVLTTSKDDTVPNSFTFSRCTIREIKKHVALKEETECLRHSPLEQIGHFGLVEQETPNPGQKVDVDKQCQHAFGKYYRFCDKDGSFAKDMCKQLWCKNTDPNNKDKHCSTKPYLPALTGTSCGHKMWCVSGACVEDENAPAQAGCHWGDRDAKFCKNLVASDPRKCDKPYGIFARFCCHTCKMHKLTRRKNKR